ncbi:MAG TPA: serine hydrolase domain-containing protein, partial [Thermomicrobiales bacterium]|nr:serine hydrolase domain-containing protein [Thermomicrobiales bacterium]
MSAIGPVDAAAAGMSAERLERIPAYFDSYIRKQKLPCCASLVARGGQVAHLSFQGTTEMGGSTPIGEDTIYRIYSMTKPVTSVAAMMLFEEGLLRLDHEVHRYIPEFQDAMVLDGGTADAPKLRKPDRPMMVRDLFLHTSGLTYSFLQQGLADEIYRRRKIEHIGWQQGDLKSFCTALAQAPLAFSPGDKWNYSNSTDVLGRVVEVASGMSLDQFFQKRIFGPLGMKDTFFSVPDDKIGRLMACYARNPNTGAITQSDAAGKASSYAKPPNVLSGGGGLASTIGDYFRFCSMLLAGGELNGVRILSPKTLEFMTMNHLPGGKTLKDMGDKTFSESRMDGSGFGLGWAVTTDVVATTQPGSMGTFSWGGMASTFFWIDPVE